MQLGHGLKFENVTLFNSPDVEVNKCLDIHAVHCKVMRIVRKLMKSLKIYVHTICLNQ